MSDPMTQEQKAQAIVDQFNAIDGMTVHETSAGRVMIQSLEIGDAPNIIKARTFRATDDIIIVNPPVYRPDLNGDVEVNGKMYTYDPLGTAAEVIAIHVGAS